jgi:hypothetical protein
LTSGIAGAIPFPPLNGLIAGKSLWTVGAEVGSTNCRERKGL